MWRHFLCFALIASQIAGAEEVLNGSVFPLPGLIQTVDDGSFIDVLKEIETCLPKDARMVRKIYPPARAYSNLTDEHPSADFTFPAIRTPRTDIEEPFLYSKPYGKVSFIIYSNKSKPITRPMLVAANKIGKYPYSVESFPNILSYFPFPVQGYTCIECSLKKVSAGRLDAFIMAMDELDEMVKKEKFPNLHRELYLTLDAVVVFGKTARGEHVKKIFDKATECALRKGDLQKAYAKVHKPFYEWQPAF